MLNTNQKIRIIRSKRKTLSIEITANRKIIIRSPYNIDDEYIYSFISKKRAWIEKHLKDPKYSQQDTEDIAFLSSEDIKQLADRALNYIPERVKHFAAAADVTYNKITIRNQKTRWGSCSSKGNLNFNCLLMLTPPDVIDYVVVHELCHRKEMNHSKKFWNEVRKILPEYEKSKQWLKDNGSSIIRRMTG